MRLTPLLIAVGLGLVVGVVCLPWRDRWLRRESALTFLVLSAIASPAMIGYGLYLAIRAYLRGWHNYLNQ